MSEIVQYQRETGGLQRAADIWNEDQRATVARYLGVRADNPAIPAYLALCATWGLDPFAGQVWLIKQKGRDADGEEHWKPSTGRDGYLAIANRHSDYIGTSADVVRERDYFSMSWETSENGMRPVVEHRYVQDVKAADPKTRGNILGAWSITFRQGRLPTYYFAPWSEHMKDPSKSAWSYRSAMIVKAAMSMTLRLSYSITGLVPADEMAVGLPETRDDFTLAPPETPWLDDDLPWPEDDIKLRDAVQASWQAGSREWTRSKLAMRLTRGDHESLLAAILRSVPADPGSAPADPGPQPSEPEEVSGVVE